MPDRRTAKWIGASGLAYTYHVYALPIHFEPNQAGNYIFSKLDANDRWIPIYIGEGDLRERTAKHHKVVCIKFKGATHVHGHLNSSEVDRVKEELDLLDNYKPAFEPNGCNE